MFTLNAATHQLFINPETGRIEVSLTDTYNGFLAIRAERQPVDEKCPEHQTWIVEKSTVMGHFLDKDAYNMEAMSAALMMHALIDPRLGELLEDVERTCYFQERPAGAPRAVIEIKRSEQEGLFDLTWDHPDMFYDLPDESREEINRRVSEFYKDYCSPKSAVLTISSTKPLFCE